MFLHIEYKKNRCPDTFVMIVLTTTTMMLIIMLRKTEMKFMISARWMHFKTVHVNTGWMTTADETGEP